jgi:hypothetical protein
MEEISHNIKAILLKDLVNITFKGQELFSCHYYIIPYIMGFALIFGKHYAFIV